MPPETCPNCGSDVQAIQTRAVLDLTTWPEVNFIRAGWDVNRWGRVDPRPMFALGLSLNEMPAMTGQPKREPVAR